MEKSCRKYVSKANPRPFFLFLVTTQNSHCIQEILLKIRCFERGLLKAIIKGKFIFSLEPSIF